MKMTIRLTFLETKTNDECRVCFRPPPFSVVEHKICNHKSHICMDCFESWNKRNGYCDFCRKELFTYGIKLYVVQDEKNKIYYYKKNFLKSLRDVKKKDLEILSNSIELFEKNFNLIEQYEFTSTKKKVKKIFFFKIFHKKFLRILKLYFLLCSFKKSNIKS
jgi:hypothetical protein